jgi:hypothetical protein
VKILETNKEDEFLNMSKSILNFLVTEYGFIGPEIDTNSANSITIIYRKKQIAIECGLDVRDEMISIRIIRLQNGNIPDVWRMNKQGIIVKEYLHALLKHRGVHDFKFSKPPVLPGISKRENIFRSSLLTEVYWLKTYALEGSASIFEGFSEPGDNF